MTIFLLIIVLLAIVSLEFLYIVPTLGARPSGKSIDKIKQSKQYKDGVFVNSVETKIDTRQPGESMRLITYIFPAKGKNPTKPLPSVEFDKTQFKTGNFVWFAHSTLMFRSNELTVLTDPVFHRATPLPIGYKPFPMSATPNIDLLPEIDVVVISHDHYDHLDHLSIRKLATQVRVFLVPLGIRDHLIRWGVPDSNIIELDWYDTHNVDGTVFTLTPARHCSGRGVTHRNSTLWGSWVIKSQSCSIFYSGDSGYFEGFKSIGEQFGPFDIAFIENGAYDKLWSETHMQPEESVQAAIDLNSKVYFPIHWGKFDLAHHQWNEPIDRVSRFAKENNLRIAAPRIGQVFSLDSIPYETWWDNNL